MNNYGGCKYNGCFFPFLFVHVSYEQLGVGRRVIIVLQLKHTGQVSY